MVLAYPPTRLHASVCRLEVLWACRGRLENSDWGVESKIRFATQVLPGHSGLLE